MPPPPRPPPVAREQGPTPGERPHNQQQRGGPPTDEDPPKTPRHLPRVLPPLRRSGRPRDPPRRRRSRHRRQLPTDPRRTLPPIEDSSGAPASDRTTSRPRVREGWGTTAGDRRRRVKGACAFSWGRVSARVPASSATVEAMPRRSPRDDRKAGHGRPGRNLSARARGEREQRRRSEAEAEENDRLEQRRRPPRSSVTVCPRGKTGYPEHVAREKLAAYAGSSRPNRPVRVYLCPHCSAWHLTSQPEQLPKVAPPARFDPSRPAIPPPPPRLRPPRPSSPGSS